MKQLVAEKDILHKLSETRDAVATAAVFGLNVLRVWKLAKAHDIKLQPAATKLITQPARRVSRKNKKLTATPENLTHQEKEEIIKKFNTGAATDVSELAQAFGSCSRQIITKVMKRAALEPKKPLTPDQAKTIAVRQEHPEYSLAQIAGATGLSDTAVYRTLKKFGEPTRRSKSDLLKVTLG